MSGATAPGQRTAGTAPAGRTRGRWSVVVPVGALLAWTTFVWVGRIRNAVSDPELSGSDRVGPLLLSASFLVLAVVVGALLYRDHIAGTASSAGALRLGVRTFAAVTVAFWLVRAIQIAVRHPDDVPFVVVHVVLAAVSISLAIWAVVAADRQYAHITSVTA